MQKTIKNNVTVSGIGLHTGKDNTVTLSPAKPDSGITFIHKGNRIKLDHTIAFGDYLNSYIMLDGHKVYTVEHLIAAIFGLGIDNIDIKIDGDEVPILDGSCKGWIDTIADNTEVLYDHPVKSLKIDAPVKVELKDSFAAAFPSDHLRITYVANYGDGTMSYDNAITPEVFINDIANARTFGFERDIEYMRSQGLIKGGSLDCAVIIYKDGTQSSPDRLPDEKIRHKVLDFIGDMGLLGTQLKGHFVIYKGGHALHGILRNQIINTL